MPKKGSQPNPSKKKKFSFDFEQTSPFNVPDEEVSLPVQSLRALKLIAFSQLGYALVGYAVTIIGGILDKANDIVATFIQAPGGISLLTIIAALLVIFECSSRNNRAQLIAYMVLVALDMVGWGVRLFFTLDEHFFQTPYSTESIAALSPFVFVLLLLVLGIVEAWRLKSSTAEYVYAPLSTRQQLISHSDETSISARTFRSLCFYALRRVCILQVGYIFIVGYISVGTAFKETSMVALELLLTPAVGIFTVIMAACVLIGVCNPHELPKRYMMAVCVDMVITIVRLIIAVTVGSRLFSSTNLDMTSYFLSTGLWNVFMFVLWIVGFFEAYRTKRMMFEHNNLTTQVDHIFSL